MLVKACLHISPNHSCIRPDHDRAHSCVEALKSGTPIKRIAANHACRVISLATLSPKLQEAILSVSQPQGCSMANSNQSQLAAKSVNLCGKKLAPLGDSGGSFEFENGSGVEVAFLIEMIED